MVRFTNGFVTWFYRISKIDFCLFYIRIHISRFIDIIFHPFEVCCLISTISLLEIHSWFISSLFCITCVHEHMLSGVSSPNQVDEASFMNLF